MREDQGGVAPEGTRELWAWLNAWLAADVAERGQLRATLVAERPDLSSEVDALVRSSERLEGYLETPAIVLAARELAEDDALLPADAIVGRYRVVNLLARGGMGDVYRATDLTLHRAVALKVLSPARSDDPLRVQRFVNEARLTALLDHPNVVRVYDVGRFDDRAYLVAELLDGETLRARIARGPMPAGEVLRIGIEIVRGLQAAHEAGLVHRDLKPENIFITRSGTAKILDFGIAKLAQDESVREGFSTLTGVVLGTAGYLAPEQIRGERVDASADLFAMGALLFEMLTARRAFAREHLVETLYAILHEPPSHALADRRDVPSSLVDIVMRLLDKSPQARFRSASDLMAALERVDANADPSRPRSLRFLGSVPPIAARVSAASRQRVRRPLWAALALVAATAVAMTWYGRSSRPPQPDGASVALAVIPFQSIPAGGDHELLELGLADALIGRLGRLLDIRVLPLTAGERLRTEADPAAAARRLGATHILTGTIQRDGVNVRASARLVTTADERTIWSAPVDMESATAFALQDTIVTRVIEQLLPELAPGASRTLAQPGTHHNEAFEAYLRGRAYVTKATLAELTRAARHFNEAIHLDPAYADAWAGLAATYRRMPFGGDVHPADTFERARAAANKALELDPSHAEAQSVLGLVAFWYEWDYERAERLLRRAVELQPSSADFELALAHLFSNLGRHEEALDGVRRTRALDPGWPVPQSLEGQFLFMARRYDEALARLDALVQMEPWFSTGRVMRVYPLLALQRYDEAIAECARVLELRRMLDSSERLYSWGAGLTGYALARMGRTSEAENVLEELRRHGSDQYVSPYVEALVLHALGRSEAALRQLAAAIEVRDHRVTFLAVDPKWDGLRGTPGFRALLSRVNLLDISDQRRER